jgi:hypothetical protein
LGIFERLRNRGNGSVPEALSEEWRYHPQDLTADEPPHVEESDQQIHQVRESKFSKGFHPSNKRCWKGGFRFHREILLCTLVLHGVTPFSV